MGTLTQMLIMQVAIIGAFVSILGALGLPGKKLALFVVGLFFMMTVINLAMFPLLTMDMGR